LCCAKPDTQAKASGYKQSLHRPKTSQAPLSDQLARHTVWGWFRNAVPIADLAKWHKLEISEKGVGLDKKIRWGGI
jgi:hypothetical protein